MSARNPLGAHALARILVAVSTLGQNVRRLREAANLSRRDLTRALGVAEGSSTVADIENDRYKEVGLLRLFELALGLGVSVEELVTGINAEYDAQHARDLPRHTGSLKPTHPSKERVGETLVAETRVLEAQQRKTAEVLDAIAEAAGRITGLVTALHEHPSTDRDATGRSKGARKVR